MPEAKDNNLTIGFIGNPNCGKTTLFNAYTGANLKVANWPGVTVEKVEGAIRHHNMNIRLVDLPGTYSLTSYTMEEIVSRQFILSDEVDVVINVVDASALERSLYLTLQLLELGKPVVMALNMMDIVEKRRLEIDLHRLPEMLGIPVVPVSARKRRGLEVLLHAAAHHKDARTTDPLIHDHHEESSHQLNHAAYAMVYSDDIEDRIDQLTVYLREHYPEIRNLRWTSLKLLEQDREIMQKYPVELPEVLDKSYEVEIIRQKYDFIEEIIREVVLHKERQDEFTDRLDRIFTNNVWGIPVFLVIMAFIFFLTFTVGDWLKGFLESGIGILSDQLGAAMTAANVSKPLQSLVLDGALGGVGTIVTFLPNILILFLSLGFLEDSGYMARVAYVMENVMGHVGLSGRAFIPMLVGFGCTVPGVMAARTLPSERDRKITILMTPFMSCGAKIPIYAFFAAAFFPGKGAVVMTLLYFLGIVLGILFAVIARRTMYKGDPVPFVMELPNYRMPGPKNVLRLLWEKAKDFLQRAFTIIFLCTIIIWFLQTFSFHFSVVTDERESMLAAIAGILVPVLKPLGFGDWRIATSLIAGVLAKESVVSTISMLFGSTAGLSGVLTHLGAASLLVFCLIYTPCAAAIASVRRELGGKTAAGMAVWQCAIAWVVSFVVVLVGRLFGMPL